MTKYLIINGSPRLTGKSAHVAQWLAKSIEQSSEDTAFVLNVSEYTIKACTACDGCKNTARCIIRDDMQDIYSLVDTVDELIIVAPVFFAGPPARLKALLDRFQSYYWSDVRERPKREALLYVIGEGGDPHGHDPLVTIVRSSLAVAGFKLESVYDFVGLSRGEIDEQLTSPASTTRGDR